MKKILTFISALLISLICLGEADYVYHEASTNTIGTGTLRYRDILIPNRTQSIKIGFKIEFQFYWNQARIYYTTDGTNPSGAFGVGGGTTQVLVAVFDHNFGSPVVDAVTATIPAQPAGTVVKYIVSAWHSGGGDEIFGNGCGNAPRTFCASNNRLSSQATIFQYKVEPLKYYINDGSQVSDVFTTAIGNDVNDGLTPNTPKATVTDLLNDYKLTGTDTVYIDRGDYAESFTVDGINADVNLKDEGTLITASPFTANYLVFKGAGRTNTIFTATASFNVFINRAKYVLLENISFINNRSDVATQNILREYGESGILRRCSLVVNNTSVNQSQNVFLRCNKRTSLDTKRSLISSNIMTNNNISGIGIHVLGDVDFSRFERNTITMTGTNGKGIAFQYISGPDEDAAGTARYWPISDTVFMNTITSNANGLEFDSDVASNIVEDWRLTSYLVESNTVTVNQNSLSTQSCVWMDGCGYTDSKDFKILKNIFKGGYSGVYISNYGEFVKIHNNYFCTRFGLYSNSYLGSGLDRENEFLHNSLYTSGSCLFFDNGSQDDWDIRNNILYTTATSASACISVVNNTTTPSTLVEWTNGNLFYRPNGAVIGRVNGTSYTTLASWKACCEPAPDISGTNRNDPNSIEGIPPYQNVSNCDLDLVPNTTNWPGNCNGYPNYGCNSSGFGVTIGTNTTGVNTDIKNIPSRVSITIGAFEVGSVLPINEDNAIRYIRNNEKTNVSIKNGILYTKIEKNLLIRQNITVFDASGKLLYKNNNLVKGSAEIDLNKFLSTGVNFVNIFLENNTYDKFTFKVIR